MSQMNTVQNIPDASDKPFDPSTNLRKRFTSKKKKKKKKASHCNTSQNALTASKRTS